MTTGTLHFVNALLPLIDETGLYEMKASGGRWISIRKQTKTPMSDDNLTSIVRLGTELREPAYAGTIDLEGRVMLPGFVDAHMHLDKAFSLAKVPNESGTLLEAIKNYGAAVPDFTKSEIKERIRKAALMALSNGTTKIRSHLDLNLSFGKEVAFRTLEAALEAREELSGLIEIQLFPICPYHHLTVHDREVVEEVLRSGVDGVGGAPHLSETPVEDIHWLFQLAERYDMPIDLHTDESDNPSRRTVLDIAAKTIDYGFQGRVTVDHLCSLAAMKEEDAAVAIQRMADSKLNAVTLPAVNLYLQGREDLGLIRRGTTRIRELLRAGIQLATASDNIQDPFHPFGKADLLQIASITAYAAHMGSPEDLRTLLRMVTEIPASIMGLSEFGIQEGNPCQFVILDARTVEECFTLMPESRWVYTNQNWPCVTYIYRKMPDNA